MARRVPGAFLWGILAAPPLGVPLGVVRYRGIREPAALAGADVPAARHPRRVRARHGRRSSSSSSSSRCSIRSARSSASAQQAGLMRDGTLPRAREALLADAIGTVAGAALGTSTVTAYIESGAGVAAGGRTGLTSLVTAALFLLSLFFYPLVRTIGGGYRRERHDALSGHRRAARPGRHDDDRRPAPHRVGRSDRGDSGVSHRDPDAARDQHHRGRGVRRAVVRAC